MRLSGRFRSSLIIGLQGIRARKLRTLLSMISLFLGVLAVVVVQAGSVSAEKAVLQDVELTQGIDGTSVMYMSLNNTTVPIVLDTLKDQPKAVAISSMQAIVGEPGVTPVNQGGQPFDDGAQYGGVNYGPGQVQVICDQNGNCYKGLVANPAQVQPPGQAIELNLTAMTGDIRPFRPFRLLAGQWLDFASAPSLSPRIVVNAEAAKGFGRYLVPAEMRIQGTTQDPTPRIVGVVEDGQHQPTAYVRTDELVNWLPKDNLATTLNGMQVLLQPDATDIQRVLTARLAANGLSRNDMQVQRIDSRHNIERALTITRAIFFGLASLVLLIGVAGILNVGLATVGERVEEFALRRAVGTPRLLLAGIVLAETLVTGLLTAGAAIGVAALGLRVVGSVLASRQPGLAHIGFPWQAAVAGVIAGLVAGVLGGLIPAIRAARIPIATVMRA
jgi:putative ABC transport system permease protein